MGLGLGINALGVGPGGVLRDNQRLGNVFEYIKQIAGLSNLKNEETGEKLLSKKFDKISFVGRHNNFLFCT